MLVPILATIFFRGTVCTIPIIKATAIKIDGLINYEFGKNWNYEYHVYKTQENAHRKLKNDPANQIQDVGDILRTVMEMLRNASPKLRQDEPQADFKTTRHYFRQSNKDSEDLAIRSTNKPKDVGKSKSLNIDLSEYSDDSSRSREIESYNDYKSDLEIDINVVDEKTTKSPTKIQRNSDEKDSGHSDSIKSVKKGHKTKLFKEKDDDWSDIPYTAHTTTTIGTDYFYNKTLLVKQYENITEFNQYVFNATKKIFSIVKHKTDQDHVKALIDQLERVYIVKFNKFLKETAKQKIKTRLGTQKVILNSIDTSTGFLNRLSNFLVDEKSMRDGGALTHNAETVKTFKKMVGTAEILELVHACKTFGICRSKSLFSVFLSNVLETILSYDDGKFKETIDAITEELKFTHFSALERKEQQTFKSTIYTIEQMNVQQAKAVVAILKNTIANRNKPLAMKHNRPHIVNSTLALLEIIDLLDTKIVNNYYNNTSKWATIEDSFKEFGVGKIDHIQSIVRSFVNYVKDNINILDQASRAILLKNFVTVLNPN